MSDSRCEELIKISDRLFQKKNTWDQLCQELAQNYYPMRADFTRFSPLDMNFAMDLMDGSPVMMRETLGNMPEAMLRQGNWFTVGSGDPERDKKIENARSLDRSTQKLRQIIKDRRSNWDIATKEADQDWVTFGNPVLSVEPGDTMDYILYRAWHPGKCAWMVDDAGRVIALFRKVKVTARNMLNKIDHKAWNGTIKQEVRDAAKLDPTTEFNCLHILIPVGEVYASDPAKQVQLRHPFISIYIDVDHRTYLNEIGNPVFNYVVPRNRQLSGLPWGFSPYTLNALQDARMLQSLAMILLEQGEKAVDPPLVAAGDIFTRDMNLFAGGTTFVDLPEGAKVGDMMTQLQTGDRINIGIEMKADVRALIADSMLINKLMLPSLREMRELEVATRNEEFRRTALPFFNPIESQYHVPVLSVTFDVSAVIGLIDMREFPRDLDGEDVKFTFDSPLNEVEGRKTVEAFFASVQITAAAKEVDDTVSDLLNWRTATTEAVQGTGAPSTWFGTPEEQKERAAKAEQKGALAEAAKLAQGGAGAIADVANANLAAQQAGMI